ncbi:MAG: membrane protein insertion efficiency factor YidD [Ruminococcus sp.]|nr:membrane protein insertion efficiency factor YidD [Ruminococcus sp.]MBQ9919633.1 membrane protein insertion efficiency factor YidD [Clostridia bacterium]
MKKIFISIIRYYQCYISPHLGKGKCKYFPTCSQYMLEAIQIHGAFKGLFMGLWRILRCNPFSKGGYDPVPEKKHKGKKV